MIVVISSWVKNGFSCICLYFTRTCPSTFTNFQTVQVMLPHFGCNLWKFPSFIHSTYVPEPYSGFCFSTKHFTPASSLITAFTTDKHTLSLKAYMHSGCVWFFLQDRVVGPMPNPLCLEGQGFFCQGFLPIDKLPTKSDEPLSTQFDFSWTLLQPYVSI